MKLNLRLDRGFQRAGFALIRMISRFGDYKVLNFWS